MYENAERCKDMNAKEILNQVHNTLTEAGYNATRQLRDYLITGDPTYISDCNGARALASSISREELLGELLNAYYHA